MSAFRLCVRLFLQLLAGCGLIGQIHGQEPSAETQFQAGEFASAATAFEQALTADPANAEAHLRLAEIALWQNNLPKAEERLAHALIANGESDRLNKLFAELHYRRNQFPEAASYFRKLGSTAAADKLESFAGTTPYQIDAQQPDTVRVPFVQTDLLPVVKLRVNGSDEVFAIIDTGGSELILDPEFAKEIGAKSFGKQESTFAGGQKATYEHGRVDTVALGEMTVANVPVHLLPTRRFSVVAGGRKVDAILGTVFLKQFHFTLDYLQHALVLSPKTVGDQSSEQVATRGIVIPFYLAGDHFIVARGQVNESEPMMMFVDTGLAGQGFTCPQSTLEKAGIQLSGQKFQGQGGGGTVQVEMFTAKEVSLGDARKSDVTGLYGPFPESLEHSLGFRLGGLVSHSFFRDYTVRFDFDAMTMTLSK